MNSPYDHPDFLQLITPSLGEFSPQRWQEFTNCALSMNFIQYSQWFRKWGYSPNCWEPYAGTYKSQRWYILQSPQVNPYIMCFFWDSTWEIKTIKPAITERVKLFATMTSTTASLIYSIDGKSHFNGDRK